MLSCTFSVNEPRLFDQQSSRASDTSPHPNVAPGRCELRLPVCAGTPAFGCEPAILHDSSIAPLTLSARLAHADYGVRAWWKQPAAFATRWTRAWRGCFTHLRPAETPRRRRPARAAGWGVSTALVFGLLGVPLGLAAGSNWAFRINTATAAHFRHPIRDFGASPKLQCVRPTTIHPVYCAPNRPARECVRGWCDSTRR